MINELPKEHRFRKKFIIPAYIYCDKHDPNMLTFLNPLVEKLNTFYETGIHVPGSGDGDITVRCMLFVATADLPARAALMNMKQFNGKCACRRELLMGNIIFTDVGLLSKTTRRGHTKIKSILP